MSDKKRFPNTGKIWTESEDELLAAYGDMFDDEGYFVAEHDLGRAGNAGVRRLRWLKKHRPLLIAKYVERIADAG